MFRFFCPVCNTPRDVDRETFDLIIECRQFMCWDVCGMDVPIGPILTVHATTTSFVQWLMRDDA